MPVKSFLGVLLSLAELGVGNLLAVEPVPVSTLPADVRPSAFTESQLIEAWGWIIARENGLIGIEVTPDELAIFLKGFEAGIQKLPSPYDFHKINPDVQKLAKARREKIMRAVERKNETVAKVFFAGLKIKTNVVELSNGICCEILRSGAGPRPRPGQTVSVHYTGHLVDGTEFMQMGPIDRILATNTSLPFPGWIEAMQNVNQGSSVRFYIPPPLPLGEAAKLGVEPGVAMIFETELFSIRDTPAEELEAGQLPPLGDPDPPSGYAEWQVLERWGWNFAWTTPAPQFGFDGSGRAALKRGLALGIRNRPCPSDVAEVTPAVERYVAERWQKVRQETRRRRLAEMEACFAALKKKTNVVELPGGLRYEILRAGVGPYPKPGQVVIVNYTNCLLNGKVVDRSDDEPSYVEVGAVIRGWNEGLQKVNPGGRIKLYIPPSLGYGEEDYDRIPGGSVLLSEIELVGIEGITNSAVAVPKKR
jgi:FKBP-type peptidyl-prolyl cis-trans isomerase